ncbi:isoprenylcysteine carboxylmethyltransferase family protein [Halobacteriovorax sp. HLS]|uniref:methyltransferase family protein n=1 Tax=Halobacteriovorax sp. HLS TaxID=2234000 RepID=UPI000FDCCF04|nr:methyltransferase [Halobacteriovorax sp. HLS]
MQTTEAIKPDYKKYIGSLIMFGFASISITRWTQSGELFFLVLSFRDLIASYFLAKRESAEIKSTKMMSMIAYISSGLPLIYLSAPYGLELRIYRLGADLLTIIGFLIVTWATIDLGTKLGVSPAKRGEKQTQGMYRFFNHPMYLGYGIAQLGWLLVNKFNINIYLISILLFILRAKDENRILDQSSPHHK